MYMYINRKTFNFEKSILKILRTNMEFLLLIQETVHSLSKRLILVVLAYTTAE